MKEFVEKLIGRLEEYTEYDTFDIYKEEALINISFETLYDIVKQLAEEYNGGWIPCSEMLPEESGEYYTYVYYDGHYMYSIDEIDCYAIVKEWNCSSDYKIIAWKPIAPYQPKRE